MGGEVEKLVEEVFGSDDVVSKLRRVQAIVTHLQTFPKRRARAAAKRARHFGCTDYASIKNILKKGLDLEPLPEETSREWSKDSQFARKPAEFDFAEHAVIADQLGRAEARLFQYLHNGRSHRHALRFPTGHYILLDPFEVDQLGRTEVDFASRALTLIQGPYEDPNPAYTSVI